jgi:antitoxin VapB
MSLNIKNEATHARVRRLAELTGLSQTAAVDDAVQRRLAELEGEAAHRAARMDVIVHKIQVELTPDERDALRGADEELYDRAGLPR